MSGYVSKEQATVYRGGGRRWFTKSAAFRAVARAMVAERCHCWPDEPCRFHDRKVYVDDECTTYGMLVIDRLARLLAFRQKQDRVFRRDQKRREWCATCGKHVRFHYGGTENRCDPRAEPGSLANELPSGINAVIAEVANG